MMLGSARAKALYPNRYMEAELSLASGSPARVVRQRPPAELKTQHMQIMRSD